MQPDTADYMKIRRYVVSLMYRSGDSASRLPTVQELTERFRVSRPTVCKALRELREQGMISAKRGVGMFANVGVRVVEGRRLPRVGLLVMDGMGVFLERYTGGIVGELIKQLVRVPVLVQQLSLGTTDFAFAQRDLLSEQLDALVWFGLRECSEARVEGLRQAGLPLIAVQPRGDFSDAVQLDYPGWGYRCGQQLLVEKRHNVAFLQNRYPWNLPYEGVRRAFAEAGVRLAEDLYFEQSSQALEQIAALMRSGRRIDAIVNPLLSNNEVPELLREVDPDSVRSCAIVQCALSATNPYGYREICYDIPLETIAAKTVELVKRKLAGEAGYADCVMIELPMVIR